jgi:hypothetical protein
MDIGTTLLILITGTLNAVCFYIGAKVGQKVVKGEPIELPTLNPMQVIREREERKEAEREQDKLDTILENIENYNGTSAGQKDVPR